MDFWKSNMSVIRAFVVGLLLCGICLQVANAKIVLKEDEWTGEKMSGAALTALQEYVAAPDSNYAWQYHPEFDMAGDGYKVYWVNMTSLRWLTDADVDKSIWTHWVGLVVPNTLNPEFANNALLWIGGGRSGGNPPSIWDKDLIICAALAQELGTVLAAVYAIPNAPIKFLSEKPVPKSRTEDAIIAYAWNHFIQDPSNPEWLPRLPMTKASVRAMDTMEAFWQQKSGNQITGWLVAGASKRGWTTWTVGACVPERVLAIVPLVLDELNFVKNIMHHYRSYGGWSFALVDYWNMNFTGQLDDPNVATMMSIIDPINYVQQLTMPKLICSTAGDEFLLPDNVDYFWDQLQGEKHFRLFPNLEHTMIENVPEVVETVRGFAWSVMSNTPRPAYVWSKSDNGTISVEVDASNPPSSATLWTAYTIDGPLRRDFRLVAIMNYTHGKPFLHPVFWNGTILPPASSTPTVITYEAYVPPPPEGEGWVGFVVELEFPIVNTNATFRISSAPSILPQTFPYEPCVGTACQGVLV